MDKRKLNTQVIRRQKQKRCYGSTEVRDKSIICKKCKWLEDCRNVKPKIKIKWNVNKT